jgi:hypothetical protein
MNGDTPAAAGTWLPLQIERAGRKARNGRQISRPADESLAMRGCWRGCCWCLAAPLPVAFAVPPAIDLAVISIRAAAVSPWSPRSGPVSEFSLRPARVAAIDRGVGRWPPDRADPAGRAAGESARAGSCTLPAAMQHAAHRVPGHAAGSRHPPGPSPGAARVAADGRCRRQFPACRRGWYPQPAALFTYRVRLSVPGDQRALVAGRLLRGRAPVAPAIAIAPASSSRIRLTAST